MDWLFVTWCCICFGVALLMLRLLVNSVVYVIIFVPVSIRFVVVFVVYSRFGLFWMSVDC